MTIVDEKKDNFENSINHLHKELDSIRTGRASSNLVESLTVDYYGTQTPLSQMASISVPDPSSIVVQPWDKAVIKDVEKAIRNSDLGINPVVDGEIIRLPVPPLTEESRKEIAKIVSQKIEEARIAIRNVREDIWREIREKKSDGEITEDDMFLQQKNLQKIVDEYNQKIKETGDKKESEVMTI